MDKTFVVNWRHQNLQGIWTFNTNRWNTIAKYELKMNTNIKHEITWFFFHSSNLFTLKPWKEQKIYWKLPHVRFSIIKQTTVSFSTQQNMMEYYLKVGFTVQCSLFNNHNNPKTEQEQNINLIFTHELRIILKWMRFYNKFKFIFIWYF